jgi:hypothetical protein
MSSPPYLERENSIRIVELTISNLVVFVNFGT